MAASPSTLCVFALYAAAVEKTDEAVEKARTAADEERICAENIRGRYSSRTLMELRGDEIRLALREASNKTKYKTKAKVRDRAKYLYKRLLGSLYPGLQRAGLTRCFTICQARQSRCRKRRRCGRRWLRRRCISVTKGEEGAKHRVL